MGSKEKRKAEKNVGKWQHNSQTKTSGAANLGYSKKLHFKPEQKQEKSWTSGVCLVPTSSLGITSLGITSLG